MSGDQAAPEPAPYPRFDGTQPCASQDPELWFPTTTESDYYDAPRALAHCRGCSFRRGCLAYALTHAVSGIWGATTDAQRDALRREHGITAEPVMGEHRTPTEIARDQQVEQLKQIEQMHSEGTSSWKIAAALGLNRTFVYRHLRALRERTDKP